MRALIVTNMWPSASEPALGSFVRDQVDALRELDGVEVEVFAFPPGGYVRAARELRRQHRRERFDVIHAHFGLTAWPALALRGAPHVVTLHGTDLRHPRSRRITRAALPFARSRGDRQPGAGARGSRRRASAGPSRSCRAAWTWIASRRSRAPRRASASASRPTSPASSSPPTPRGRSSASTARRRSRATRDFSRWGAFIPSRCPSTSTPPTPCSCPPRTRGSGSPSWRRSPATCPVLATPVGVHPAALDDVPGTLCAPYDRAAWQAALAPHVQASEPRVAGRDRAALWSARRMARRVLDAWGEVLRLPVAAPNSSAASA